MRISDWSSDVCSSDLQLSICIRFKLRLKFFSFQTDAGWSSLAARRAHNPKVVGSNPAPATSTLKPANCAMQLAGFDLGRKFRAGNLRTKNIALRAQNIAGKPAHETTSSKRRAANDGQKATGNKPTRPAPDFARPGRQKRTVGFQTVCAH